MHSLPRCPAEPSRYSAAKIAIPHVIPEFVSSRRLNAFPSERASGKRRKLEGGTREETTLPGQPWHSGPSVESSKLIGPTRRVRRYRRPGSTLDSPWLLHCRVVRRSPDAHAGPLQSSGASSEKGFIGCYGLPPPTGARPFRSRHSFILSNCETAPGNTGRDL